MGGQVSLGVPCLFYNAGACFFMVDSCCLSFLLDRKSAVLSYNLVHTICATWCCRLRCFARIGAHWFVALLMLFLCFLDELAEDTS